MVARGGTKGSVVQGSTNSEPSGLTERKKCAKVGRSGGRGGGGLGWPGRWRWVPLSPSLKLSLTPISGSMSLKLSLTPISRGQNGAGPRLGGRAQQILSAWGPIATKRYARRRGDRGGGCRRSRGVGGEVEGFEHGLKAFPDTYSRRTPSVKLSSQCTKGSSLNFKIQSCNSKFARSVYRISGWETPGPGT